MPVKYEVNVNPHLFIDAKCKGGKTQEEGYISYRMVICHAIKYCVTDEISQDDIRNNINKLANDIEKEPLDMHNFFETYISGNNGPIIIIDRSKGCYPLILYRSNDKSKKFNQRIDAFKISAQDILEHFDDIYLEIQSAQEFNEALHCKLEHLFNDYKKPSKSP